ncbi:MAG: hypothetical protein JNK74_20445 [Candidatus Hydrogenedentes bacterium]|nr:hypothetical protein [Candidatus Hydrogenedentota bacterium]
MRNSTFKAPTALSAAVAAWNNKARGTSAPVLRHIFATIRNLQRLRSGIRHFGAVDEANLKVEGAGPVDALRVLCARLDDFEQSLADLSQQAHGVTQQGESLVQDFLALSLHGAGAGDGSAGEFQVPVANWDEGGAERLLEADVRALDHLIEMQRAEIDALNRQLSDAEHWLTPREASAPEEPPRFSGQIELQSVREFVQNSPIASIPINASYYERILEAASNPEGHKVPMGRILTGAGVVTERQLQSALEYQREGRRQALGGLLVDLGYTTEDAIAQALAAQLALPYVVLANEAVDSAAVSAVPAHLARRHTAFPLRFHGHALCVAMANPLDLIALEDLRIASDKHIRPVVAARGAITGLIERYCV